MTNKKIYGLQDAYKVSTPEDNIDLYRNWAETYDQEFAEPRGYSFPTHLAQLFEELARKEDCPILDVGAGTGLVAQAMREVCDFDMDAIDISPEMLEVSRRKNIYRRLIEADLSKPLNIKDESYGAFISVGTFTHGHVGPQAVRELIRIAKPNALFCLGINSTAFDKYSFGSGFAALQASGLISPLQFVTAEYYGNSTDDHGADVGYIAVFRKA